MLIKIAAVQAELGQPLSLEEKIYIFKQRPDFVCRTNGNELSFGNGERFGSRCGRINGVYVAIKNDKIWCSSFLVGILLLRAGEQQDTAEKDGDQAKKDLADG